MRFILISLILCCQPASAQITIEGIVHDTHHNPLEYVSVGITGTSSGSISDQHGYFRFMCDSDALSDSIKYTILGFIDKTFSVKDFITDKKDSLLLIESPFELNETVITPQGLQPGIIGNKNTDARMKVNFYISNREDNNLGSEIGRRIRISKETVIEKFNFYLAYNNFDTVTFRINIYSIKGGKPFKNLLTKNILKTIYNKETGWMRVDLTEQYLTVNDDIIVSIEWVGCSQKGKLLSLPITFPSVGALHYYKFGSQNKWKTYFNMSSCMYVEVLN